MAKILLSLSEENLSKRVAEALRDGRHELVPMAGLVPEGVSEAASALMAPEADVVIIDYWAQDAASVKLLQTVSDFAELNRPSFIFIEKPGKEASREEILMVMNEGAQALLPYDFQPQALSNYVERGIVGPGRLRPRAMDPHNDDVAVHRLEEAVGELRTRSSSCQKLISRLLSTPLSAQNRKTLVVSDSSYQLEMLKKILEDHGFQVLTAGGVEDALKAAISERPRIIISDLELEGQTGLDLCQAVKFTHQISPCFFVICTANQNKMDKIMVPGNGVDDCLRKPSGTQDTMEFIARVALGLLIY
ncbi:MAG: response regulator [Deltaproteobacteria bacterium]|nr:response regulator [Deltaproteobacteria bacterium]